MKVKRVELSLDPETGMQMAAIGCLLMVAQFIADERPAHADMLRKVARALMAQISEEHLKEITRFAADMVRDVIKDEVSAVGKVH